MPENIFKWKYFQPDIIMLCVRWYLKYTLSYRNLVEMFSERGLSVSHTTIMRWVIQLMTGSRLFDRFNAASCFLNKTEK